MVDNRSSESRSRLMSRVLQKNTKPEMVVRKIAHALGYRFRLHRKDLPGTPDIIFPKLRKAIFVHGCFWHRHDCKKATTPKSNADFWKNKFEANVKRDRKKIDELSDKGWDSMVIWECETKITGKLECRLKEFLGERPCR